MLNEYVFRYILVLRNQTNPAHIVYAYILRNQHVKQPDVDSIS